MLRGVLVRPSSCVEQIPNRLRRDNRAGSATPDQAWSTSTPKYVYLFPI